jgi:hypothetical protein
MVGDGGGTFGIWIRSSMNETSAFIKEVPES